MMSRPLAVSLKAKLSTGFLAVTLCCAAVAGALVDHNVSKTTLATFEERLSYETTMLSQMTATALFGPIDPTDTSLDESVHALGRAVRTELSILASDGSVVADSDATDLRAIGSQANAPEIVAARATGAGTSIRDGRMYVARAIARDAMILGFARSSVPMTEVTGYVLAVRRRMAWGSAIALVVAFVLGLLFSSRLVRPLRALSDGARRVGAGDFERAIEVRTNDEIGTLASAFNDMMRNLRQTVAKLDRRNRDMRIVLDNVTQGLLTVDRSGVVSAEKSTMVERWFGPIPPGTRFVDCVGRGDPHAAQCFAMQWEQLLDGMLPLDLVLDQLPRRLTRDGRLFELSFTPIFEGGDSDRLDQLLVVIADVTARVAAERAEAEQREVASILERATRDKSGVLDFLLDAETLVRGLSSEARPSLADTRRALHTLKGNCAIFGLQRIAVMCHQIESRMEESGGDLVAGDVGALREAWSATAGRLSALLGNASQVVIDDDDYRAVLRAIVSGTERGEVARMVREWRMDRLSGRLERFGEQARALGQRLDKRIDVEVSACSLRLPREAWSSFWAGFVHVVRNAVDHGIEPEEDRIRAGKSGVGHIRLSATRTNREVVIEIADDGRGIDWPKISARAVAMGLPAHSEDDRITALFTDGVSSKDTVTELSGRGVGLGALRAACSELGGSVTVASETGRGTALRFRVPLVESSPPRSERDTSPPRAGLEPPSSYDEHSPSAEPAPARA
jgi:two-component system chemotaxis sensor kinase CheA